MALSKQKREAIQQALKEINWWKPPTMWHGKTCYIIGGGPSLMDFDFTQLHDQHVIGCNDAYMLGPWVDVCVFGDYGWWLIHNKERVCEKRFNRDHPGLSRFPGIIVSNTPPRNLLPIVQAAPRTRPMRRSSTTDALKQPCLAWFDNVGVSAIHLALLFGAARVVLLGYDMGRRVGAVQNWHRAIKALPPADRNAHHVKRHIQFSKMVKAHPEYSKVSILNANPESACTAWSRVPWNEVRP